MSARDFAEVIKLICKEDSRFDQAAYFFAQKALEHTPKPVKNAHCSAAELLEGIRKYALSEYGPMALFVLKSWGITSCEDWGEVVFNLVECGLWHKTNEDELKHFQEGYDFAEAFSTPFKPIKH